MPLNKGHPLQVTSDDLTKHKNEDDCWTAIRGPLLQCLCVQRRVKEVTMYILKWI